MLILWGAGIRPYAAQERALAQHEEQDHAVEQNYRSPFCLTAILLNLHFGLFACVFCRRSSSAPRELSRSLRSCGGMHCRILDSTCGCSDGIYYFEGRDIAGAHTDTAVIAGAHTAVIACNTRPRGLILDLEHQHLTQARYS